MRILTGILVRLLIWLYIPFLLMPVVVIPLVIIIVWLATEWEDTAHRELRKKAELFDSHPSLKSRLKAMRVKQRKAVDLAFVPSGPPMRTVLPAWKQLEEEEMAHELKHLARVVHQQKQEVAQILRHV